MANDGRLPADKLSASGYAPGEVPTATGRGGFKPGTGGGGLVIVDDTEPASPATGQLWYDTDATC